MLRRYAASRLSRELSPSAALSWALFLLFAEESIAAIPHHLALRACGVAGIPVVHESALPPLHPGQMHEREDSGLAARVAVFCEALYVQPGHALVRYPIPQDRRVIREVMAEV